MEMQGGILGTCIGKNDLDHGNSVGPGNRAVSFARLQFESAIGVDFGTRGGALSMGENSMKPMVTGLPSVNTTFPRVCQTGT